MTTWPMLARLSRGVALRSPRLLGSASSTLLRLRRRQVLSVSSLRLARCTVTCRSQQRTQLSSTPSLLRSTLTELEGLGAEDRGG